MKIKTFTFNSFQVNTYIIETDEKNAIIIDAACHSDEEKEELAKYIEGKQLSIKFAITTHAHIDHILGNAWLKEKYKIDLLAHKDSKLFYDQAPMYASFFALDTPKIICHDKDISDLEEIILDNILLRFFHTPGHADGSICIYLPEHNILFSGDVLFESSIGRTDLPGGNFEQLISSIKHKLLVLPNETIVYPGHGPSTNIGEEKQNNPYF